MDPFGEEQGGEAADLSNFQPPADASAYNGDFYEVDSSETQATFDYDPSAYGVTEQQEETPAPVEYEAPAAYVPEPVAAAPMSVPVIEEENELTKFMRKYEGEIAAKAQEQEKVGVECKEKAKHDMEQFTAERSRIKESKQQSNRVQEQATLEKLALDLESENPWERVVSLVDLETNRKQKLAALNAKKDGKNKEAEAPKPVKKEEEEDVSRMRQLFVQLKADPLEKTRAASIASH
ncbi:hypothetical protein Poli38472_001812 [Pythium oligandrum]|uniref:Clathrin light chain n=1 Tax=Pythium oligandrum TaxID=41045 RepID=A0A8K1CW16_PYTOL|nr:hypothetical protein Poli38472_001812 [Pythium oligandrum]|eukprot:TMW69656.1 hypothetical protein Poli38472_001812 [Pythium oligandrum]